MANEWEKTLMLQKANKLLDIAIDVAQVFLSRLREEDDVQDDPSRNAGAGTHEYGLREGTK
jgi:hypothetical protein